jgi:DNA-binding transcriptional MocR family regulator
MTELIKMSREDLLRLHDEAQAAYESYKAKNLKYDMSRGKPCPQQLDLTLGLLDCLGAKDSMKASDGTDCRNYGLIDGIPEAKELFSKLLEVNVSELIVGGSSSLTLMYDSIARAMTHGVLGSPAPWGKLDKVKFICPCPGYDRHFAICEFFGIEMINVDMLDDGPDMDAVEALVSSDESIKGIWCVPKYSNPEGKTYSDKVVLRMADLKPKAKDFRIFWDNAYTVHHLTDTPDMLLNILDCCKRAGNPDMVYIFASTSKVSFAGAGVAMMGASEANIGFIKKQLSIQTIGPDKINQLRHVKYFKDMDGITQHMKKQAAIIKPKFDAVDEILSRELGGLGAADWTKPNGGYFMSFNTMDGCAKAVVAKAREAGVTLTDAGATYPYKKDPRDRNIRIAPTYPSMEELRTAIEVLCVCVKLVESEKLLG